MKKAQTNFVRFVGLVLLAVAGFVLSGCASTNDPENTSTTPWNSPRGWESGLPVSITEGR